jgi:outer membrane protein assembly factor BamA
MRTSLPLLLIILAVYPARAQLVSVGSATKVRSVSFDIASEHTVEAAALLDRIAVRGMGRWARLRRTLSWAPFVAPVAEQFFDPVEVQRDKERLRRFFVRIGYPDVVVTYDVTRDEAKDRVDLHFRIRPGPPLIVRSVALRWELAETPSGMEGAPGLTPIDDFAKQAHQLTLREGAPLDERALGPSTEVLERRLADRGYVFASVQPEITVDSTAYEADIVFQVRPGPRVRIGRIDVMGSSQPTTRLVRKFLPVEQGDLFSLQRIQAASQRIEALEAVGHAAFEVASDQPVDSLVNVVLHIREDPPRDLLGQAGYSTTGGIDGELQWRHRRILRGGQALTANLAGQSGALALIERTDRFVRSSLTFSQPVLNRTNFTLVAGPFGEYRSDFRDHSLQLGLKTTLLYQVGPLSSIALSYELATRRIYEYQFGDFAVGSNLLELLQLSAQGVLNEFGGRINSSVLSLSGSLGTLPVREEPRRGFHVLPSVATTVPGSLSSTQYVTANIRGAGYLPLSNRVTLAVRLGAGKLFPFGQSVPPTQDEGLREYFRLRDVLFTAGGSNDVRGWPSGLLGPKFPQIIASFPTDSTVQFTAARFVPIGGFNRVHGTIELRLPLPYLNEAWGTHIFVDAGRIWTRDSRFTDSADPLGVEKLFWALGAGLSYNTPIGALRVACGYKLNPSVIDLADPQDVTQAIVGGTPLDQLPQNDWWRFRIHLGIGYRL